MERGRFSRILRLGKERARNSEKFEPQPFVIRGQHLEHYAKLLNEWGENPNSETLLDRMVCIKISLKNSINPGNKIKTEHELKKTYKRFMILPPDYPVEIVEGIEDEICKVSMGKNDGPCAMRNGNYHIDGFGMDNNGLNKFMQKARKLGLTDAISPGFETAEFSDANPVRVRTYKMEAGVLKTVLGNW